MNDLMRAAFSLGFAAIFIGLSPLDQPGGMAVAGIGGAGGIGFALFFYLRGRTD